MQSVWIIRSPTYFYYHKLKTLNYLLLSKVLELFSVFIIKLISIRKQINTSKWD